MKVFNLRLEPDIKEQATKKAKQTGRSLNKWIIEQIKKGLKVATIIVLFASCVQTHYIVDYSANGCTIIRNDKTNKTMIFNKDCGLVKGDTVELQKNFAWNTIL